MKKLTVKKGTQCMACLECVRACSEAFYKEFDPSKACLQIIERNGGWKWHLLTEDIEFSANSILEGIRIAYTPTAVLYDEQPVTFRDSWNQRFRWAKGFYQVFWHYGARLAKGVFTNPKGSRFACYDMLMTIAPGMLLTIVSVVFNAIIIVLAATGAMSTGVMIASSISSIFFWSCGLA